MGELMRLDGLALHTRPHRAPCVAPYMPSYLFDLYLMVERRI